MERDRRSISQSHESSNTVLAVLFVRVGANTFFPVSAFLAGSRSISELMPRRRTYAALTWSLSQSVLIGTPRLSIA